MSKTMKTIRYVRIKSNKNCASQSKMFTEQEQPGRTIRKNEKLNLRRNINL